MLSSHLVYISILISEALAQTPSNYVPSSSQSLQTAFGGVNVTAPGVLLLPSQTQNAPSVIYPQTSNTGLYVLIMVDPDPNLIDGSLPEYVHWVQANVTQPSADSGALISDNTEAFVRYLAPSPPSTPHRYIITLWQQPDDFTIPPAFQHFSSGGPSGFNTSNFASTAGLDQPLAATWFYVNSTVGSTATLGSTLSPTSVGSSTTGPTANPQSTAASLMIHGKLYNMAMMLYTLLHFLY